jgi:hydrogenase assembly chaperone HypC/HupF
MTAGDCGSDHCVTCSDEGIPMRIVAVAADGLARCIDDDGTASDVMTDLVEPVQPGDAVLVHAGVALTRVTESPEDFR